jgi:hypothetical protein
MFSKKTRNSLITLILASLVSFFPFASTAQAGNVTSLQLIINPFVEALFVNVPLTGTFPTVVSPDQIETMTVQLAAVTVTDTRRSLLLNRTWTTNAVMTNLFSATDTLTADTMGYSAGEATMVTGLVGVTEYTRIAMNSAAKVTMGVTITGNHVASWRPTLSIPVPALAEPGTYIGTLTHSVF